jgi:hypothetical protein
MNEPSTNPVWVSILCLARCLIPLLLLLSVSYILKRLGVVSEPSQPSEDQSNDSTNNPGDLAHGQT